MGVFVAAQPIYPYTDGTTTPLPLTAASYPSGYEVEKYADTLYDTARFWYRLRNTTNNTAFRSGTLEITHYSAGAHPIFVTDDFLELGNTVGVGVDGINPLMYFTATIASNVVYLTLVINSADTWTIECGRATL